MATDFGQNLQNDLHLTCWHFATDSISQFEVITGTILLYSLQKCKHWGGLEVRGHPRLSETSLFDSDFLFDFNRNFYVFEL